MEIELIRPPRTAFQVFKMMPEGTLAEVIDNQLYMSPAPNPFHHRLSIRLSSYIFSFLEKNQLGEVFHAPTDLFLDEHSNAVQPDILFFSKKNNVLVNIDGVHGVPDFIIEILSPGNKDYDLNLKKNLYQKFGVKEYWIIDPETNIATGFELINSKYEPVGELHKLIRPKSLGAEFKF